MCFSGMNWDLDLSFKRLLFKHEMEQPRLNAQNFMSGALRVTAPMAVSKYALGSPRRIIPGCQIQEAFDSLRSGRPSYFTAPQLASVAEEVRWCQPLFRDDKLRSYALGMCYSYLKKMENMLEISETASDVTWAHLFDRCGAQKNFQEKLGEYLDPAASVEVSHKFLETKAQALCSALVLLESYTSSKVGPHWCCFNGSFVSLQDTVVHVDWLKDMLGKEMAEGSLWL